MPQVKGYATLLREAVCICAPADGGEAMREMNDAMPTEDERRDRHHWRRRTRELKIGMAIAALILAVSAAWWGAVIVIYSWIGPFL
jgi:hypothetical protein